MNEQYQAKSSLGNANAIHQNRQRERDEFVVHTAASDSISKEPRTMSEVDEEVARNAALSDELEKALVALHDKLGPVLRNDHVVASDDKGGPSPVRQSPMANMMQVRNDRLEQFVNHVIRLRRDLAI